MTLKFMVGAQMSGDSVTKMLDWPVFQKGTVTDICIQFYGKDSDSGGGMVGWFGSKLWNALPVDIREASSLNIF